jgi:transposase
VPLTSSNASRKNHYGSRSLRGTEVAAVFYTLCETARLACVDPQAYLLRAVYAAIDRPGAVTLPEDQLPNSTL